MEEDRIFVIQHGVSEYLFAAPPKEEDTRRFREENRISKPYFLYVGRRIRYKNFGTVLRAWARVTKNQGIDTFLVSIGPQEGLESWQMDFLIENRLEERLVLLSNIDDRDLGTAYSGAAGFIFPSLYEGFGIPLLESMVCNTPIICSDIPVFHEVAADGALYFDPHDDESLPEAMVQILDDQLRQDLIRKGRKRLSHFSWEKSANQLAEVYRSIA